jgi:hypothetical protein
MRNEYKIVGRKPQGKRHMRDLGVEGRKIMDLKEIQCGDMDWIQLVQHGIQW